MQVACYRSPVKISKVPKKRRDQSFHCSLFQLEETRKREGENQQRIADQQKAVEEAARIAEEEKRRADEAAAKEAEAKAAAEAAEAQALAAQAEAKAAAETAAAQAAAAQAEAEAVSFYDYSSLWHLSSFKAVFYWVLTTGTSDYLMTGSSKGT